MSLLEALIDFSDEELPDRTSEEILIQSIKYIRRNEKIVSNSDYGERIRNGFVITLIGRPNVGKSSLYKLFI